MESDAVAAPIVVLLHQLEAHPIECEVYLVKPEYPLSAQVKRKRRSVWGVGGSDAAHLALNVADAFGG